MLCYLRLVGQEGDVDLRQSLDDFRSTALHHLVEQRIGAGCNAPKQKTTVVPLLTDYLISSQDEIENIFHPNPNLICSTNVQNAKTFQKHCSSLELRKHTLTNRTELKQTAKDTCVYIT